MCPVGLSVATVTECNSPFRFVISYHGSLSTTTQLYDLVPMIPAGILPEAISLGAHTHYGLW